jgi:hypothetical protein
MGVAPRFGVIAVFLFLGIQAAPAQNRATAVDSTRQVGAQDVRCRICIRCWAVRNCIRRWAFRRHQDITCAADLDESRQNEQAPMSVLVEAVMVEVRLKDGMANSGRCLPTLQTVDSTAEFIRALASLGKTKVLAEPTVMVANGQVADVQIGRQLPYQTTTENQWGTVTTTKFVNVGTALRVRALAASDGTICLDIREQYTTERLDPLGIPQVDGISFTGNVTMPDGATVAIAGPAYFRATHGREDEPACQTTETLATNRHHIVVLTASIYKPGSHPAMPGSSRWERNREWNCSTLSASRRRAQGRGTW